MQKKWKYYPQVRQFYCPTFGIICAIDEEEMIYCYYKITIKDVIAPHIDDGFSVLSDNQDYQKEQYHKNIVHH